MWQFVYYLKNVVVRVAEYKFNPETGENDFLSVGKLENEWLESHSELKFDDLKLNIL